MTNTDFNDEDHDGPWWAGMVKCRECSMEHAAVIPVDDETPPTGLECTRCHKMACDPSEPGEFTEEPPDGSMLWLKFYIDTDGYTDRDREMFAAGFEYAKIADMLNDVDEGFTCPIRAENSSRVRMAAARFRRRVAIEPPPVTVSTMHLTHIEEDAPRCTWLQLVASPKAR